MTDRVASISSARRKALSSELSEAIGNALDRELDKLSDAAEIRATLLTFTGELASALCSVIDSADDRSQGLVSAGVMRNFLQQVALELSSYAKDRATGQPLGAKLLESTAEELRICAENLDGCQALILEMMRSANGVEP